MKRLLSKGPAAPQGAESADRRMAAAASGCRRAAGGRAPRAWDGQEKEVGHDGPGSKTR